MTSVVNVVVIDDSALIRKLLTEILNADKRLKVVACAKDAYEARESIKQFKPDVITLDIEMPKMNGITFLENLMRLRPMPVVMISTLTQEGAPVTLQALELGAVDFIGKPAVEDGGNLTQYAAQICDKVFTAGRAKVRAGLSTTEKGPAPVASTGRLKADFLCAIGASTGGTEAIKEVVTALPESAPPIVVTQHIPESFSASFAKRVNSLAAVKVYEAENNQPIRPGSVYIAPGHSHLRVVRSAHGGLICRLKQDPPINRHRPSVSALFDSVLECKPRHMMAIMLTGMGADGAKSMLGLRTAGFYTLAQNEQTSVVWGMPGAAVKCGAVQKQLALNKIAQEIMSYSHK